MTARTLMITAGALFVLAAPAAQANLDRMNSPKASITKQHKISPAHGTTVRVHKVKKTTGPIYIHFPGTSAPSSSTTSSDDCANYMVDCTDEQSCSFWSTNCGSILAPSTTDATPVEPAQVASPPQSEAPATEAPPVSTAGSDNRSARDKLFCPGGGLWDEDHEYCV